MTVRFGLKAAGCGVALLAAACSAETLDGRAFGLVPDTEADMVPAVRRALAACTNAQNRLVFAPGRYDFYPDGTGEVTIAFHVLDKRNLTLDGGGAEFVFHGLMMPVRVERSEAVTLRGFSVDWDRPFITQGTLVGLSDTCVEVAIDKAQYPYEIENGRCWFTAPDWDRRRGVEGYNNLYDRDTREIVYRLRDNPLGIDFNGRAEEVRPGVVRFFGAPRVRPPLGTFVALNHGRYIVKGIDIVGSRDVAVREVTLYHVLSGGVVGARTENLTVDGLKIIANAKKGRVFSGVADGIHIIHCKGEVVVNNVEMTGHGDDFLNVHGRNCAVTKRLDDRTVRVVRAECTEPGDEVWLIRRADVQRREVRRVASVKRVPITHPLGHCETKTHNGIHYAWGLSTDKAGEWEVAFTEPLPADFGELDFYENKTWNASLRMTNCRVGKSHRARGVLVTTPEKVVIADNVFRTAGTAILIEGDTDHWYESGANTDVLIRDNVFEDCLTSGSESGTRWEWGEAVITVTPSHEPASVDAEPYHRNIRIERNAFRTFDVPLVRARSVRGFTFSSNVVERTRRYAPFAWQRAAFSFEGCREVVLRGNRYDDAYEGRDIWVKTMRPDDLKVEDGRSFDIRQK